MASTISAWGLTFILMAVFIISLYEVSSSLDSCSRERAVLYLSGVGAIYGATLVCGWQIESPDPAPKDPRPISTGPKSGTSVATPSF